MSVIRLGGRLAAHRPGLFALGTLAWTAWWAVPIGAGLALQAIFDTIAGQSPVSLSLGVLVTVFVAVEATRVAMYYAAVLCWLPWWVSVGTVMRANMLQAQLASGGPSAGPVTDDPGAAVAVFRDDVDDFAMWIDTWLDLAGTTVFAAAALAIMLRIDSLVTLVVVVPLVVVFVVNRVLTPRIRGYRRADREATQRVTGFLGELFASVLAVKVAGAEDAAVSRLGRLNSARRTTAVRDKLLTDSLHAANTSIVDVSIGLVLLLVAGSMRAGTFTVGDLALFTTYVAWLAGLPRFVGLALARHRHAQVSASRMAALLPAGAPDGFAENRPMRLERHRPAPPRPHRPATRPAEVRVRGLTYRHPDGTPALTAIDLDLAPGTLTVVTGPVGAGKSTLLRVLLGLLGPAEGEVRVDGRLVDDLAAFFVPPRSAYVGQVPRLFTESLRDNLLLGTDGDESRVAEALRLAVLDTDVAEMPHGLDTVIGSRGVRLSGGQVQRAAAARALAAGPALLVVDDLSSALDVATEQRLWAGLRAQRSMTVLAVSHRPATLALADQIVMLQHGRVVSATSPAQGVRGS
jgi:ATP-binding cassette, subfamily B, bacterial